MKRGTVAGFVDDTFVFALIAWMLAQFSERGINPRLWDYAPGVVAEWLFAGLVFAGAVNLSVYLRKPAA
jgi:hypothetical protein